MVSPDTQALASLGIAALSTGPMVLLDRILGTKMPSKRLRLLISITFVPPSVLSLSSFIASLYFPLEPGRSLLTASAVVTVIALAFFLWNLANITPKSED